MKKLILMLTICLNSSMNAAIGDGMRINKTSCQCIEHYGCNGYCC